MYTDFITRFIAVKTVHVKVSHVTILESSVSQFCTCQLRTANVCSLLCNAENTAIRSSCQLCSHRRYYNTTTWSIIITRNSPQGKVSQTCVFGVIRLHAAVFGSRLVSLEFATGVFSTVTYSYFHAVTSPMTSTIPGNEMEQQQLILHQQHIRNDHIAPYRLDIVRLALHAAIEETVLFMAKTFVARGNVLFTEKTFVAGETSCSWRKHM
jgi:hypothetical protein